MKVTRGWPVLLALLLTLSACGAGRGADTAVSASTAEGSYLEEAASESFAVEAAADLSEDAVETESVSAKGLDSDQVKLIYRAEIEMEALDFDAAVQGLEQLVEAKGGYFESASQSNYGSSRYASFTIRVPSEAYQPFLDSCSDWENCTVLRLHRTKEDVGSDYFDVETRLETQRTKLERLQTLLAQAENMEDIIALEDAISQTEYQIDLYSSELNRYDSLVDYATINLDLSEVTDLTEAEGAGFWERMAQNLRWGLAATGEGIQEFLLWAAYHLLEILGFAALAAGALILLRRRRRRKMEKKLQEPRPAQPEPSEENK